MAAQILQALSGDDADGDGVPDRLLQLFNDTGFSLNSDNWKKRRVMIFWTVGSSWALCLVIAMVSVWKLAFGGNDITPNTLNLVTSIFYAMMGFSTTLIISYAGLSTADSNSYRKHSADIAKTIPPPQPQLTSRNDYTSSPSTNYGGSVYERPNPLEGGYGYEASPSPEPAPIPTEVGGPVQRKAGIIM